MVGGKQWHASCKISVVGGKQGHASCKISVVGGKQGHASYKIFMHQQILFLCQLTACHSIEVNLTMLSFWGYFWIYNKLHACFMFV